MQVRVCNCAIDNSKRVGIVLFNADVSKVNHRDLIGSLTGSN